MTTLRPTKTLCPVCDKTFQQPARKQGGGKHTIYCSSKCRSLDWSRGEGGGRVATILDYERVPEDKNKKVIQRRESKLRKYGWSESDFTKELERQNSACFGCLTPLDRQTARLDHKHGESKPRGILCDSCNWALGHAKDSPATLRRLMAYLDHDRSLTHIYLIGALKNKRIPQIGNNLRKEGFDVMDEWHCPGEFADTNWQSYEKARGRSYTEALRGRSATNNFLFDRSYLDLSDIAVLVAPCGKSGHLELGYAKGRGKTAVILLDGKDPERYDIMPGFADLIFKTEKDLTEWLKTQKR